MLYLTYDNNVLTDGAGAQILRILGIFLIAKYYGVGYIHSGLAKLSYQGVLCMEKNEENKEEIEKYNALINLPNIADISNVQNSGLTMQHIFKVFDISEEHINAYKNYDKNVLFVIQFPNTLLDSKPEIFLQPIPCPLSIPRESLIGRNLRVAIHIRRGDCFLPEHSIRMLPNSYYVDCMRAIQTLFSQYQIPYEFHLYTEQFTAPRILSDGITQVSPESSKLEDFAEFSIKYHINECPVESLKDLVRADVLLCSRSCYSYIAGILKQGGIVLFPPCPSSPLPGWISTSSGEDILKSKDIIIRKLFSFLQDLPPQ